MQDKFEPFEGAATSASSVLNEAATSATYVATSTHDAVTISDEDRERFNVLVEESKITTQTERNRIKNGFEKFTNLFYGITLGDWIKALIFIFIIANGFSGGGANSAYP